MKIYIKNMICPASKYFVKLELERLEIGFKAIEMGELDLINTISEKQVKALKKSLQKFGLEIVEVKPAVNTLSPLIIA